MSPGGSSVPVDRIVAVVATLKGGREQVGSGYLVSGRLVLTAEHCTRDKGQGSGEPVPKARLRVIRASDGAVTDVADIVADRGLDVAVLQLADNAPWAADLPATPFARVDQSQSGVLDDCTGIGFPLFQRDPDRRTRHTSEFHGTVYQTDEREDGRLLMREPRIHPGPVTAPEGEARSEPGEEGSSPWGGLSGALMFYRGSAIGVVVEHHPRQGDNALIAIGFKRIAADSAEIRQCLGLPGPDSLPWVSEQVAVRAQLAGWPLAEVRDPFALEVHRPVQPDELHDDLPALPAYVPRDHDAELGSVVRAAAAGSSSSSRIAVLVGGSSTGKTRACWEALGLLRDQLGPWRLWHPIDPSRPEAALAGLPGVGPRTVVWLNEAQLYLDVADRGLGERVAAGLRELLRDPSRAPVLVLATLWPQYWDDLTARPAGGADLHAQARELLDGHDITVPAAFTAAQLQRLSQAGDARLAQAATTAQEGQVIQFLAGAPELLARYRNAPPAAAVLIHTAMDARRLGTGIALPRAFLEAAAPGYLTDDEWDALDDDWLEQALDYAAKAAKGIRGPLARIRARPARSGAVGSGSRDSDGQLAGGQSSTPGGPLYRLADYLDQHGRTERKDQIPPAGFWAAAADHAFPADQAALGDAAHARGLYRAAAQLHKNAARCGNPRAVYYLSNPPHYLRNDVRPMRWAAAHVALDDPYGVAGLLDRLREAGAQDQAAALLARDPAAHVSLEDSAGVARLLGRLREAGAQDQAAALLARDPAAHVALEDPGGIAMLLDSLREAGAQDQAAALAGRAAHVALDDPGGVAMLLDSLRRAGATEQAAALLARDPAAPVALDNPDDVASLLDRLREAGAQDQAAALLARDPAAHVALDDPGDTAWLLDSLREAGAQDQAAVLLARDPAAHVALDNPGVVASLLDSLREAGAQDQAAALARRAAAHVALDNTYGVPGLLDSLREAGAQDQAAALAGRLPGAGMFELFLEQEDRQDRFRFGREADGSPAGPWGWEDLD